MAVRTRTEHPQAAKVQAAWLYVFLFARSPGAAMEQAQSIVDALPYRRSGVRPLVRKAKAVYPFESAIAQARTVGLGFLILALQNAPRNFDQVKPQEDFTQ